MGKNASQFIFVKDLEDALGHGYCGVTIIAAGRKCVGL